MQQLLGMQVEMAPDGQSVHYILTFAPEAGQTQASEMRVPMTAENAMQIGGWLTGFGGACLANRSKSPIIPVNGILAPNGHPAGHG